MQRTIVSVITPFFDSANTLERCIKSVLAQSHNTFEYILADNRSGDGSSRIARMFAASDSRIRYIFFEEHISQRANYNRALRHMSRHAEYCKIVQADDYLLPNCLEEMLLNGQSQATIGVVGALRISGEVVDPSNADGIAPISSGRDICRATLSNKIYAFGSPTSVMYRADLVRQRREFFDPNSFFADTDVVFDLLRDADFGFVNKVLTFTDRNPRSTFGKIAAFDIRDLYLYMAIHRVGANFFGVCEASAMRRRLTNHYYTKVALAIYRRADRWNYLAFHLSTLRDSAVVTLSWRLLILSALRLASARIKRSFTSLPRCA